MNPYVSLTHFVADAFVHDIAEAFSQVLVSEEGPQAPVSAEARSVQEWVKSHIWNGCLDILEVYGVEPSSLRRPVSRAIA